MSEPLPDVEEARLNFTSTCGKIAGLVSAEEWLKEKAGKYFVLIKDMEAKLCRSLACGLHQDIEVLEVERLKRLRILEDAEKENPDG